MQAHCGYLHETSEDGFSREKILRYTLAYSTNFANKMIKIPSLINEEIPKVN